jgi:hypothetical protein
LAPRAAIFHLGLILRPLARIALLCPCLDHRLGAGDLGQPLLPPREFLGDLHPVRHLGLIGRLRLTQQIGHFGLLIGLKTCCVSRGAAYPWPED